MQFFLACLISLLLVTPSLAATISSTPLISGNLVDADKFPISRAGSGVAYTGDVGKLKNTIRPNEVVVGVDTHALTLVAANTDSDNAGKTIVLNSPVTMAANLTLATDRAWRFEKGAVITTTGYTFNANGASVDIGDYQVFTGSGTVTGLKESHPEWFGALRDGTTDDDPAMAKALASLSSGGVLLLNPGTYLCNSVNHHIDTDNVVIQGSGEGLTIVKRTSSLNGYVFWWARNNDTSGGGLFDLTLEGVTTNASGNGGAAFGYDSEATHYYANDWNIDRVVFDSWSQYGLAVNSGNNWNIGTIRVVNHGITTAYIASCIGFYVYPKAASSGGHIDDVYSEISSASAAIANSAAIKLQVHSGLRVGRVYGKGGSEECMVIDSADGAVVDHITIEATAVSPGLSLRSRNPNHAFVGSFTINSINVVGAFSRDIVIAAGTVGDTDHVLEGVTIRNVKAGSFTTNNYASFKDCVFENFNLSSAVNLGENTEHPTLRNTGNIVRNINTSNGQNSYRLNDSLLQGISVNPIVGSTTQGVIKITGNNNILRDFVSRRSASIGVHIVGDNNYLLDPVVIDPTTRTIWVQSGRENVIVRPFLVGGTGYLDNGTLTRKYDDSGQVVYRTAAPTTGLWTAGQRIANSAPAVGQPKGWLNTTTGGAKSTTRANTTAYAIGVWALWTTGTSVWEVTTAGTSDGSAPDITGLVVGDTVVDGTVTWTLRSLTTAAFTSEGNL